MSYFVIFFYFKLLLQRVYAMGDVYPESAKLPKGDYSLQLLFIERKLDKVVINLTNFYCFFIQNLRSFYYILLLWQEAVQLSFYTQLDGPVTRHELPYVVTLGRDQPIYFSIPTSSFLFHLHSQPNVVRCCCEIT